jgi:hypothetical protein
VTWRRAKIAAFSLLYVLAYVIALGHVWQTHSLVEDVAKDRVSTTGTISHIDDGRKTWDYEIEFSDAQGGEHTTAFTSAWWFESLEVGDPVRVAYSRSNPSKAYATGHRYQISSFLVLGSPIAVGLVAWRWHTAEPGRHERRDQ